MDPLELAIANLAETKRLLEQVVISSESFDYRAAKAGLASLERMRRQLAKAKAHLEAQRPTPPNILAVNFPARRAG